MPTSPEDEVVPRHSRNGPGAHGEGVCISLLKCRGHPNVQLRHETTLELEVSTVLTPRGDCIACIACEGAEEARACASVRGLAAIYLFAANPWEGSASASVYGLSPGEKPNRLIVRVSRHRRDSISICSSSPAAGLPGEMRRLLQSPFTRCLALYVTLEAPRELLAALERAFCQGSPASNSEKRG